MSTEIAIRYFIVQNLMMGDAQKEFGDNDSLFGLGVLDSMSFLRLVTFLEEQFKITIEDHEVVPDNFETINHIKAFVENKQQNA